MESKESRILLIRSMNFLFALRKEWVDSFWEKVKKVIIKEVDNESPASLANAKLLLSYFSEYSKLKNAADDEGAEKIKFKAVKSLKKRY